VLLTIRKISIWSHRNPLALSYKELREMRSEKDYCSRLRQGIGISALFCRCPIPSEEIGAASQRWPMSNRSHRDET
jgi:hypothetical protein